MNKIKKNILIIIANCHFPLLGFLCSCALQLPPSGGPTDKIPPEILKSEPKTGTLNFNSQKVVFEFNKYMNKSQVIDNLYISPNIKYDFSWSGRFLEIEFLDKLDTNTTYSVNLGTDYTDLKGNKPANAYSLVFSTGNKLDSGIIRGMLIDKKMDLISIFAYRIDKMKPDTLDIRHTKPDYRVMVGTSGKFELQALKDGIYRVMAIRDMNKDGIYDEGTDGFGATESDFTVSKLSTPPSITMKIGTSVDLTQPMLYNVETLTKSVIRANFSKPMALTSISKNSFKLTDSLKKVNIDILSAYSLSSNMNKVEIITKTPLDTNLKWRLTAVTDSLFVPKDTIGNRLQDTAASAIFYSTADDDTLKIKLPAINIKDSTKNVNTFFNCDINFNTGVSIDDLEKSVDLIGFPNKDKIKFNIIQLAENSFKIKPEQKLNPDNWYQLSVSYKDFKALNRSKLNDTTFIFRFQTFDDRNLGAASGTLTDSSKCSGKYIINLVSKTSGNTYSTRAISTDSNYVWEINYLPQDNYSAEIFCDSDNNGKFTYGNAFPYKYCEKFKLYPTDINIKPRWKVENLKLNFNAK